MMHPRLKRKPPVVKTALSEMQASKSIICRALLIVPVNTLTNWENEFDKWIGISSGNNISLFFHCIDGKQEKEVVVENWIRWGGVLCVSGPTFASMCKTRSHSSPKNIPFLNERIDARRKVRRSYHKSN